MLWVPVPGFRWQLSSQTTQPAAAYGDTITPGTNTPGTTVAVFTSGEVANDVYGVLINVNSNGVAATLRNLLVNIRTDPAGGTAWTTVIPNLLCAGAGALVLNNTGTGGVNYYFPLFIKSGSSIGVSSQVDNATVGTHRVWMTLFGQPIRPDLVRVGRTVTAYGVVTATSEGTVVTPGTAAEGTYVSLGTPTVKNWWWQLGAGCSDTTQSTSIYFNDLAYGDATNKHIILENHIVTHDSGEDQGQPTFLLGASREVPASVEIFARSQASATPDTDYTMAAYGVSG